MSSKPLARPPRSLSHDHSTSQSPTILGYQSRASRNSQMVTPTLAPLKQSSVPTMTLSPRSPLPVDLGSPYMIQDSPNSLGGGPLSPNLLHSPRVLPRTSTPLSRPAFVQRKQISDISLLNSAQLSLLKRLCSRDHLPRGDFEWWETLLSKQRFPVTATPQDSYDLEMVTVSLAIELASNNIHTENFNTLLAHSLSQLRRVLAPGFTGEIPDEAYNALFLLRVFSKHFAGNLSGEEIRKLYDGTYVPTAQNSSAFIPVTTSGEENLALGVSTLTIDPKVDTDSNSKSKQLLGVLIDVVVKLNPYATHSSYELYNEVLNCLIVLLSTQIHQSSANTSENNYFLNILMTQLGDRSNEVIWKLITNILDQKPPPPVSASLVYNAYSYLFATKTTVATTADPFPISDRSLLLTLLLTSQANVRLNGEDIHFWKKGIVNLQDEPGGATSTNSEKDKKGKISFRKLYEVICNNLQIEEICLLFNAMMTENENFRVYVLSRTDPETLYLPLLKLLYETVDSRPSFSMTYILTIILLIFSQDEIFNDNIQRVTVEKPIWYVERSLLKPISLGGLAVLVIIRIIQSNLSQHRDIFIHTNCLATLANMSQSIQEMHQYVAQKLVNLFDLIAKKYQKISLRGDFEGAAEESSDIMVYSDLVAFLLNIMNSILIRHLKSNLQLIYTLLHRKDVFPPLYSHPRFREFIDNIESVINFFHDRIEETSQRASSAEDVLGIIELSCRTWPPNRLKPLPEFAFAYEESGESAEFFVPFVWALIFRKSFIYWDDEKTHILHEYRYFESGDSDIS